MTALYTISEFCKLTGTTKRTLQYYDEIGLLKPMRQNNGYRRYTNHDLLVLHQILTLKHLDLPISQIEQALDQDTQQVEKILLAQSHSLRCRARLLTKTADLVDDITFLSKYSQQIDWSLIAAAIRALQADDEEHWFTQFYEPDELAALQSIWGGFSESQVTHYIQSYTALAHDIQSNSHQPPYQAISQSLALRFYEIAHECYGHMPILMKKILVTYRVGMLATDVIPLLDKKAFHYLVESLAHAEKLHVFL